MSDEKPIEVTAEISLDADADTVWRALTEGEEISRWFSPDARVRPGVGGAVWLSWGEGAEWEAPIEIWEPGRHLRTADPAPSKLAVDYFIESRGGETVLRIVHSGFDADAWDDELQTLDGGWRAFLATLRHYLAHHRGEPRTMASFRHPAVPLARTDAFARLLAALGFGANPELRNGDRFDVTTTMGDRLTGVVDVFKPPINLSGSVENWNNAFVTIEIEPGRGQCRPAIWFSLYGEAGREAGALQARLRELLTATFAES